MRSMRMTSDVAVCTLVALCGLATVARSQTGETLHGLLYVSQYASGNHVYELPYAYDGESCTLGVARELADLPTAAGLGLVDGGSSLIVAGQGYYCGGCAYKVDIATGTVTTGQAGNNNNHVSLSSDGSRAYLGWKDTPLVEMSVDPFSRIRQVPIGPGESPMSQIAFARPDRVFYVTGGESEAGHFGVMDTATWTPTRIFTFISASGVIYEPFSDTLLISGFRRIIQVRPDAPSTVISTLELPVDSFLALASDGAGHLAGTWGDAVTFIDYSPSGLIGDSTTFVQRISTGIPTLSGQPAMRLIEPPVACVADFNQDGGIDGADVEAFFAAWESGDPTADADGSGGVDGSDVNVFFSTWEAGGC